MPRRRRGPDLRLALPAVAAWLAAAVGLGVAPRTAAAGAGAAVLAGMLAARRRVFAMTAGALGVAVGAGSAAVHVAAVHSGPVAALASAGAHVTASLRLTRDPEALTSRHGARFLLADATVTSVRAGPGEGWEPAGAPVVVLAHGSGWLGLLPGQRLVVAGRLVPDRQGAAVSAVLLATGPPLLSGRPPPWQRAAGRVRAGLRAAVARLPDDERGLLPGLVLGDTAAMPPSLTQAFRVTGLTHLNAVSGANVAIVLGAVGAVMRRAGAPRRLRPVLAATALAAFVVLVRPSPSVLRAAVMGAVVLAAVFAGRRAQPLPALAAAVLLLVVVDPWLARTPGFALSVLATGAIVLAAPRLTDRLARRMPRPVAAAVAVPAVAQLACLPVIVGAFGQLSPLAIPANLLAAPAVAPATVIGVTCAVVAVALPGLAAALAWAAAVPVAWLADVARTLARLPGAATTWPRGARGIALLVAVATLVGALAHVGRRLRHRCRSRPAAYSRTELRERPDGRRARARRGRDR